MSPCVCYFALAVIILNRVIANILQLHVIHVGWQLKLYTMDLQAAARGHILNLYKL